MAVAGRDDKSCIRLQMLRGRVKLLWFCPIWLVCLQTHHQKAPTSTFLILSQEESCECCLRSLPKWVLVELQSKHARCWLKVRLGYNIKLEDFWSREWSEVTVQWNLTLVLQQILKYIPLTLFVLFLRRNASSQAVLQLWEYMQLKTLNTQE